MQQHNLSELKIEKEHIKESRQHQVLCQKLTI